MRVSIPEKPSNPKATKTIWAKLGWFVGLWIASVTALAIVAYGIKLFLK
jgi:hypothetical protein